MNKPRIDALTSLRGIAALWVLVHNDFYFLEAIRAAEVTQFWAKGYLAVDFFLVLSGFVLFYVHGEDFESFSWSAAVRFLCLRFARIYPLYLFVLAVRVAIELVRWFVGIPNATTGAPAFTETTSLPALVANVGMVQAWGGFDLTWVPTFWTVSAEWFCYLCFPLLVGIWLPARTPARNLGWQGGLSIILCVGTLIAGIFYFGKVEFPVRLSLVRCVPEFLLGVLLAKYGQRWGTSGSTVHSPLILLVLIAFWVHFGLNDGGSLVLICLLILSCSRPSYHGGEFLQSHGLVFLGEISYSIYLTHMIVQSTWRVLESRLFGEVNGLNPYIGFLVKLVITLAVSATLFYVIERPARRWLRNRINSIAIR